MLHPLQLTVNGVGYTAAVEPHRSLLSVLRDECGLTGAKEGCDDSECGACMVTLDGKLVNSCSFLAVQAEGKAVTTVEGIGRTEELHPLQQAFLDHGGVQCGYCTPGMIVAAKALLDEHPDPDEATIRRGLAGNLCRCTGYQKIVRAVQTAAAQTNAQ
jgi:aerobic-type carbon monoxide dehydrogenase small subunit (CoxS/CutS family)